MRTETARFWKLMAQLQPVGVGLGEGTGHYARAFLEQVGIPVHSGSWGTVALDDERFGVFLDAARVRIEAGEATFSGLCMLIEEHDPNDIDADAWYRVEPSGGLFGHEWPSKFRAHRAARYRDLADYRLQVVVSENVRSLIESSGWRGASLSWISDEGKYSAKQWFGLVPETPIGRGLDHRWVKPDLVDRESSDPAFHTGARSFRHTAVRPGTMIANARIRDVLDLFTLSGAYLSVIPTQTFLNTPELRNCDFAYGIRYGRSETVLVRGRVAAGLVSAGFATPEEFIRVDVYDEVPQGFHGLDGGVDFPLFGYFDPIDRQSLDDRESSYLAMLDEERPAPPAPSLAVVLKELRRRKRENPTVFRAGMSTKRQESIALDLPDEWRKVLAVANGGCVAPDCEILPIELLGGWADEVRAESHESIDQQPIAVDGGGDWYSLMFDAGGEADGVGLFTHEGGFKLRTWDSIAEFLDAKLDGG